MVVQQPLNHQKEKRRCRQQTATREAQAKQIKQIKQIKQSVKLLANER
ncbi:hypothetical protein [Polaromonas sp. CG9_12]|nr:hypothetical protein [Polaromonas sp. CG9_12]